MAVGKRLRFQIFRRDNFACRYCGITAQAGAVLEVDHIQPRAEGGEDAATNLVTACEACNAGKSDTPLSAPVVEDVPEADLQRALAARKVPESGPYDYLTAPHADLTDWAEEMDVATGLRWFIGFQDTPDRVTSGRLVVSRMLAIACGYSEEQLCAAALEAGKAGDPDLLKFLPMVRPVLSAEERQYMQEAGHFLAGLVPSEQRLFIWLARLAIEPRRPTREEVIRVAADIGRRHLEEYGRDPDVLWAWLSGFPSADTSRFLYAASAEWDAHHEGAAGMSSFECRAEVLEIAVAISLQAEVPA